MSKIKQLKKEPNIAEVTIVKTETKVEHQAPTLRYLVTKPAGLFTKGEMILQYLDHKGMWIDVPLVDVE